MRFLLGWAPLVWVLVATADAPLVQPFLVREIYLDQGWRGIGRANQWRMQQYTCIRRTEFFGHGVLLHESVHESLDQVQEYIVNVCINPWFSWDPYEVKTVSGWRASNTYRGHEISNHVFGIALDINPTENTCCGCKGHWAQVPECTNWEPEDGPGPHTLPECWIRAFNHFGWYWLGNDPQLRDTMHFEYLAKPERASCR